MATAGGQMKGNNVRNVEENHRFKPLRLLYLHGIDSGPRSTLARQMRRLYGFSKKNGGVYTPELLLREVLFFSTLGTAIILLLFLAAVIICWVVYPPWVGGVVTGISLCVGGLLVFIMSLAVPRLMLSVATNRAMRAFETFRPNLLVASSFGAVVLFHMRIPKLPLLLLSPAQEAHRSFFATSAAYSLRRWPYVLVVHPKSDPQVPLEDSVKLIETAKLGRARLEVIEGGSASIKKVEKSELQSWVTEVFERGREQVLELAEAGMADVDASLFLETDAGIGLVSSATPDSPYNVASDA